MAKKKKKKKKKKKAQKPMARKVEGNIILKKNKPKTNQQRNRQKKGQAGLEINVAVSLKLSTYLPHNQEASSWAFA